MNSDPHESAAWRAFGMLDTDETAGFDEAARLDPAILNAYQEVNSLSAAIAAATVSPVKPHPVQLDRLHARLGLNVPKRRNWKAISGWSAAAAIALLAILDRSVLIQRQIIAAPVGAEQSAPPLESSPVAPAAVDTEGNLPTELFVEESVTVPAIPVAGSEILTPGDLIATAKVETRRLIQQIEVLREQLADMEKRDRERFDVVPGMSMSVLIEMRPPGFKDTTDPSLLNGSSPPMTAMIGDALAAANSRDSGTTGEVPTKATGLAGGTTAFVPPPVLKPASAYPIYDPARDTGTIVVDNLPPKTSAESYNLWVTTKKGRDPVLVGELPESTADGENRFDFSLGDTGVVPAGFYMTKDPRGKSRPPSTNNTILQGPN